MASLVVAEHDNASLRGMTFKTVTAAVACSGEVYVLVAGHNARMKPPRPPRRR